MEQERFEIKEGMTVSDNEGDRIGEVAFVQFSDENAAQPGPETATSPDQYYRNNSFFEDLVTALTGKVDLPDELAARLMREGYIRINGGFARSDSYATMDQVSHVADNQVHLNVDEDQLIRL